MAEETTQGVAVCLDWSEQCQLKSRDQLEAVLKGLGWTNEEGQEWTLEKQNPRKKLSLIVGKAENFLTVKFSSNTSRDDVKPLLNALILEELEETGDA